MLLISVSQQYRCICKYAFKSGAKDEVKANVPREVPVVVRWYHILFLEASLRMCILYCCVVCGTLNSRKKDPHAELRAT